LPAVSTGHLAGVVEAVNGSTVWVFDPAANFTT